MKADPWENAEFQRISLETLWIASFYQLDIGSIHLPCDNIWFRIHKSTQRPVRLFSVSYTSGKPCTCKKTKQTNNNKKNPNKNKKLCFLVLTSFWPLNNMLWGKGHSFLSCISRFNFLPKDLWASPERPSTYLSELFISHTLTLAMTSDLELAQYPLI